MRIDVQKQRWNKSWFVGVSYDTFGTMGNVIIGFIPLEVEITWQK